MQSNKTLYQRNEIWKIEMETFSIKEADTDNRRQIKQKKITKYWKLSETNFKNQNDWL